MVMFEDLWIRIMFFSVYALWDVFLSFVSMVREFCIHAWFPCLNTASMSCFHTMISFPYFAFMRPYIKDPSDVLTITLADLPWPGRSCVPHRICGSHHMDI